MNRRAQVVFMALAVLACPAAARAGWFFGLGAGVSFGGSLEASKRTFTGQFATPGNWAGVEIDFGYSDLREGLGMRTLTASLLVGHPVFGKVRAYGSVGGGIDGPVSRFKDIFLVSGRIHTIEVITYGGGVMSDLGNRFGVRFDARVFEDIKKTPGADPAHFMFTRVTGNVYVKF